ncbi:SelT-like protein [Linum perenne]
MDRSQILLLGLPIFLFCSDVFNLFLTSPPPPKPAKHGDIQINQIPPNFQPPPLQFPTQLQKSAAIGGVGSVGIGNTVNINFCTSCSYKFRGSAVNMKKMLENEFPGLEVILSNYPPPLPKRLLGKVVPVFQFGMIGLIMGGEQIFPRLGFATPPAWYYSLRANRFGSIASAWLFGNFAQSFLQSSGAFEVYCNGEMVFSKLREHRFPGEIELRDIVGKKLAYSSTVI